MNLFCWLIVSKVGIDNEMWNLFSNRQNEIKINKEGLSCQLVKIAITGGAGNKPLKKRQH